MVGTTHTGREMVIAAMEYGGGGAVLDRSRAITVL